jgi:hypothetical protein
MKKLFVCALAVAMVFAFTAPTMAADWNFYGSARFATFSNDVDPQVAGVDSDTDTLWATQGNSRIGANVSAGDVGGRFEYGTGINLRLLYGTWNFGAGTLIVGQDYTPMAEFYSNQVWATDEDLLGNGMAYTGREGQIKLRFGGFDIAFVTPVTQATLLNSAGATVTSGDNDVTLPKIMMSYKFATDMFSVKPYLGYQTYDFTTGVTSVTQQESIDSWVYGVGGKVNFGPAYVAANIWGGTNAGNFGMYMAESANAIIGANGEIVDNDTLAYAAVIGFKASDMFTIEGGYGTSKNEIDYMGVSVEDTSFSYYINCTINLAPGVFVVPEFGVYSLDEIEAAGVSIDQAETTYFGAKWQINF